MQAGECMGCEVYTACYLYTCKNCERNYTACKKCGDSSRSFSYSCYWCKPTVSDVYRMIVSNKYGIKTGFGKPCNTCGNYYRYFGKDDDYICEKCGMDSKKNKKRKLYE